jgi:hypothetical protein
MVHRHHGQVRGSRSSICRDELFHARSVGSGVALLDYDNDGRLDVYFAAEWPDEFGRATNSSPEATKLQKRCAGSGLD